MVRLKCYIGVMVDKKIIIYVLCYDDKTEEFSRTYYQHYDWARIYRIKNQSHLFEGVMYQSELLELYNEWKDVDYVGTISHSFLIKMKIEQLLHFLNMSNPQIHDVIFFKTLTSDLFHLHSNPDLKRVYQEIYSQTMPVRITCMLKRYSFYNYWIAKPSFMLRYIQFFNNVWLPAIEKHPLIWNNAGYDDEKLSPETLSKLTKRVAHYPMHPFINERIPFPFFKEINARILF
jgi:hypothetical protein